MKIFYSYKMEDGSIYVNVDKPTAEKMRDLLVVQLTAQINTSDNSFEEHFEKIEDTMKSLKTIVKAINELEKENENGEL